MKKLVLFTALIFFVANQLFAQETDAVVKVVPVPEGYAKQLDVVYKQLGEWKGKVDIYYQPGKILKPTPVVINMHGGAWRHGSKEAQSGFATYFKLGFAVANVEYRLSSQGKAPGAVEDVRCAMMYLINHADSLNIDVNKIIFCGSSAGAHLALLAGLMNNSNTQFDNGCEPPTKKYTVAAIIAQSTPSVLFETTADGQLKVLKDGAIYEWFGSKKDDAKFAQQLSPITYVAKNNPPIFLSHGNADPRVPYQQSVALDAALTAAGVKHVFVTIDGGGHGGYAKEKQNEIKQQVTDFLNENVINKQ
jgi:acetyl esterase/lipase